MSYNRCFPQLSFLIHDLLPDFSCPQLSFLIHDLLPDFNNMNIPLGTITEARTTESSERTIWE
jgi:hypothetical protein